jgi:hypothetical protein
MTSYCDSPLTSPAPGDGYRWLNINLPFKNFSKPFYNCLHPHFLMQGSTDEVWHTMLCAQWHAMWQKTTPRLSPSKTLCYCKRERNALTLSLGNTSLLKCERNAPALSLRSTSLPARAHARKGGALSRRSSTQASTSASTARGTDGGMVTGFRASETLPLLHDRLCTRCKSIVRFRSCADDSVGAASNYEKVIQSFKDQKVHNLAYVRTLLAPSSG